jgi:uncharacterized protein (DUF983 family)
MEFRGTIAVAIFLLWMFNEDWPLWLCILLVMIILLV